MRQRMRRAGRGEVQLDSPLPLFLIHQSAWKEYSPKTIASMLHSPVPYAPIMAHFPPAPRFKAQDLGMVKTYSLRREALRWCWRRNQSRIEEWGWVAGIRARVGGCAHPPRKIRL